MRKIVASEFVTLDGVMEDPHLWMDGIHFSFHNEQSEKYADDLLFGSDALLLGRVTYEAFAGAWSGRDGAMAERINGLPKYVASSTLKDGSWGQTTVISGDVLDGVARVKQGEGGPLLIYGSRMLVHALMQRDLVDEFHVQIDPIVVGKGIRLFDDAVANKVLKLERATPLGSGVVVLVYAPGARPAAGS